MTTKVKKQRTVSDVMPEITESAEAIINDEYQQFPEAASVGNQARQGDVYIMKLAGVPNNVQKVNSPHPQIVPGNTRGSRHILDSLNGVTMYAYPGAEETTGPIIHLTELRTLTHPEHGDIGLPPGTYGITFQREHHKEEFRKHRAMD